MALQLGSVGGSAVIIVEESTGIAYWSGDIKSQGTTRPSTPTEGWIHINTSGARAVLEFYDGGAWRPMPVNLKDLNDVDGSLSPSNASIFFYNDGLGYWTSSVGIATGGMWVSDTNGNAFLTVGTGAIPLVNASDEFTSLAPNSKGDLLSGTASADWDRHEIGTDGDILRADSGQDSGLDWDSVATVLADGNVGDLSDVSTSSDATGDILVYDGSAYANEPVSGTSFPGTPREGQKFYRTDLEEAFYYDSSRSKWLGEAIIQYDGFDGSTISATTYTNMRAAIRYSSTVGFIVPFDCVVVGMTVLAAASSTGTCFVRDDGSNVTGASIALSSATTKTDQTLNSSTIASGSILGFTVTSGSFVGIVVTAQVRRVAT